MDALAFAKLNLGLRVGRRRRDGFHPIRSLFQSISIADRLTLEPSDEDAVTSHDGGVVIDDVRNLAWRAVAEVRTASGGDTPVRLELSKRIPVAAGLGGGSADAAAALGLAGRVFGVPRARLLEIAPTLGSDVPFCFHGGLAVVSGRGEEVSPRKAAGGYGLALVVPPVELSTAGVYRHWDELGEPTGPAISGTSLPPGLRSEAPLVNDLYPAAAGLAPSLDDWRDALVGAWGRPVLMSGSGPTLFGFFVDRDEALAALDAVPIGARTAEAAQPLPVGWILREDAGEDRPLRNGHHLVRLDEDDWREIALPHHADGDTHRE